MGRHQFLISVAPGLEFAGKVKYRDRDAVTTHIEPWVEANPFGLQVHSCSLQEIALRLISCALVHNLLVFADDNITRYYFAE